MEQVLDAPVVELRGGDEQEQERAWAFHDHRVRLYGTCAGPNDWIEHRARDIERSAEWERQSRQDRLAIWVRVAAVLDEMGVHGTDRRAAIANAIIGDV